VLHRPQAILSQFSKTNKATTDSDDHDEDDAVFSGLQEVDDEEEVEPEMDDDDGDEIDSAVDASDNVMVDEVAREVEEEEAWEEQLTRADINLGRFSLSKVSTSMTFIICF
jgi:hypothetical protein